MGYYYSVIDKAVQDELWQGSDNREELERMLQVGRLLDQENKSLAYKKGWLWEHKLCEGD